MMTPDEHIQEVLDRGTGWERMGEWLVLELKPPGCTSRYAAVIHSPESGTWGLVWIGHGIEFFDVPPVERFLLEDDAGLGHFTAGHAADEAEELVRVRGLNAAEAAERAVRS